MSYMGCEYTSKLFSLKAMFRGKFGIESQVFISKEITTPKTLTRQTETKDNEDSSLGQNKC